MKRFFVDWAGNYVFFVPIVLLFAALPGHWPREAVISYMLSSVLIAAVSGRAYTWFLKHFWYRLFKEGF